MIVVDTDVVAYAFVRHDRGRAHLTDRVTEIDRDWAVPVLWLSEFRNVLASLMRFRGLDPEQAKRLALAAERQLEARTIPVYSPDVLDLVSRSGLTAYDCEFVAAARALGVPLVTGDRRIADAFPETAVTMEDFVRA